MFVLDNLTLSAIGVVLVVVLVLLIACRFSANRCRLDRDE